MRPQHDLIAFYRHALRAGDVPLARRLTRALYADPQYRRRAQQVLAALPALGPARVTPGGQMLDELLARIGVPGDNHDP